MYSGLESQQFNLTFSPVYLLLSESFHLNF